MRKVVLFVACSLDGQIARLDGAVDWLAPGGEHGYAEFEASVDVWLLGRKTYDDSLGLGAASLYEGREVYVFSRGRAGERSGTVAFVDDDPAELVARIRERPGKDLWLMGGGELVSAFLERGLIDELRLFVHPIVIGAGRPLFSAIRTETRLRLMDSRSFPDGLVELRYQRAA